MKKISSCKIRIVSVGITLLLSACGGEFNRGHDSSSGSSSSSSSSSSGSDNPFVHSFESVYRDTLPVHLCSTSVGKYRGEYPHSFTYDFAIEESIFGRLDFPEFKMVLNPGVVVIDKSHYFVYSNIGDHPIKMNLWVDGKYKGPMTFEPNIPLGPIWLRQEIPGNPGQYSLVAVNGKGGLRIEGVVQDWRTKCFGVEACEQPIKMKVGHCVANPPGLRTEADRPPAAYIETDVVKGDAPLLINFDASLSYDINGGPLFHQWDFSDGTTTEGEKVSHTFKTGIYYVKLLTTDSKGLSGTKIQRIEVGTPDRDNSPPKAVILADRTKVLLPVFKSPDVNTKVRLDASASSDPDGDSLEYIWLMGSDNTVERGPFIEVDAKQVAKVQLGVSDGKGGLSFAAPPRIQFRDYPKDRNCEADYITPFRYPNFDVKVSIYNRTSRPLKNWKSVWEVDQSTIIIGAGGADYEIAGPHQYKFSDLLGEHRAIPPHSWLDFTMKAVSPNLPADTTLTSLELESRKCKIATPGPSVSVPQFLISTSSLSGPAPLTVDFDGSKSFDADGLIKGDYAWYLERGRSSGRELEADAVGMSARHTYNAPGQFSGYLSIETDQGIRRDTISVQVTKQPGVSCAAGVEHVASTGAFMLDFKLKLTFKNLSTLPKDTISGELRFSNPVSFFSKPSSLSIQEGSSAYSKKFALDSSLEPGESVVLVLRGKTEPNTTRAHSPQFDSLATYVSACNMDQ